MKTSKIRKIHKSSLIFGVFMTNYVPLLINKSMLSHFDITFMTNSDYYIYIYI